MGEACDIRIEAHLKHVEREWRHLVDVHITEVLERAGWPSK
jgi:hypothetical protein